MPRRLKYRLGSRRSRTTLRIFWGTRRSAASTAAHAAGSPAAQRKRGSLPCLLENLYAGTAFCFNSFPDSCDVGCEQRQNSRLGSIVSFQPEDMWRSSVQDTQFFKVRIVCNDHKSVRFCVLPDLLVRSSLQAQQRYLCAAGECLLKERHQTTRQIFVQQQLH